jgi:hypothetical protein
MKRVTLLFIFTISCVFFAVAQQVLITGVVRGGESQESLANVTVATSNAMTTTDAQGKFSLQVQPYGKTLRLTFSSRGFATLENEVEVTGASQIDLGEIILNVQPVDQAIREIITEEDRIPVITLSSDDEESELGGQSISGILSAARDPFIAAAAFNLSTGGFEVRGYESESVVLFNGMPFNFLENGAVFWSVWGGLNDVTRNRESTIDLSPGSFTFGGIGGATAFDTRASEQRKQRRFSYMFSNRTYTGRLMGTWSTGMLPSGWAFSFSGSRRWADEGYVPGTFYNAWSYFASIDKKLGQNHLLNLTALGSLIRRGSQGASTDEFNDLAGTKFYNPHWGWQNGEKRNARVVDAHQPLFILRHDWSFGRNASLATAVGYQFGKYGRTDLDWFNAPDPRGDYYRKSVSYATLQNEQLGETLRQIYLNNRDLLQIQWHDLYEANRFNGQSYGNEPGIWSQYVIGDQRADATRYNASSTYQNVVSDLLTINFGLTFQQEKTHYFKQLDDLLGGDYYTNLDRFALEDNLPGQSANFNLENDDVIVREGDTYGWDYDITGRRYGSWLQGQFTFRKVDFFLAGDVSRTEFWRTGHFRNGRFQNNSFGESEKQDYLNFGTKGGLTYKINGRNYLYANAAYIERAPDARTAYASPRNRDVLVPNLTKEQIYTAEGGYQLRTPGVRARATFFYTQFNNDLKLNRFYLAEDIANFGTYILYGLDRRHAGVELALRAKLSPTLSLNGAAAIGEYIYTSRPDAVFIQDDDGLIRNRGKIFIKNFYVPSVPQTAASVGLDYRSPKFWSASVTVNYFNRTYLDFSPERRTAEAAIGLEKGSDFYNSMVNQIRAPEAFTVDLFANKSFKINDGTFFYLTTGVTNLLNAEVVTGGFEQLRFNKQEVQETGINIFPERRFYAFGTNFFVLGAIRF